MSKKVSKQTKRPSRRGATSPKRGNSTKIMKKTVAGKTAARSPLSGEALPRRTLEQAFKLAETLHGTFAGKSATWDELAKAVNMTATNPNFKYHVWSAQAYGIINKEEGKTVSLSELGRKIVAPTYDGEDAEGKVKAVMTPALLSKFYTDYNHHPVPGDAHFPNVLESKYSVPRERVTEAMRIILDNGRYAGILKDSASGQPMVKLGGGPSSSDRVTAPPAEELEGAESESEVKPPERVDWSRTCFYITPIGDDGSDVRKHADMMLKHLVEPVSKEFDLKVVRADKIEKSGLITQQIFDHLVHARLCIADLSFSNPNAFYELGVRHMCRLPTIQVIRKGDRIPFDVAQGRTIIVDTSDVYTVMDRLDSARRELGEHVRHVVTSSTADPADDNPIASYLPGLKVTIP